MGAVNIPKGKRGRRVFAYEWYKEQAIGLLLSSNNCFQGWLSFKVIVILSFLVVVKYSVQSTFSKKWV